MSAFSNIQKIKKALEGDYVTPETCFCFGVYEKLSNECSSCAYE